MKINKLKVKQYIWLALSGLSNSLKRSSVDWIFFSSRSYKKMEYWKKYWLMIVKTMISSLVTSTTEICSLVTRMEQSYFEARKDTTIVVAR